MIGPEALLALCIPGACTGVLLIFLAQALVMIVESHDRKMNKNNDLPVYPVSF